MPTPAKLLIIGSPDGEHSRFVSAISEVKVKSSARKASGEGTVPMDFGRVRVDDEIDLQIFGVARDSVATIADAVSPGIIGAVLILGTDTVDDPHFSRQALDDLTERGLITVIATSRPSEDPGAVLAALGLPTNIAVVDLSVIDKQAAKQAILMLLEAALQAAESAA